MQSVGCLATRTFRNAIYRLFSISAGSRQTVSTIPCGVDRYLNFVLWSVKPGPVLWVLIQHRRAWLRAMFGLYTLCTFQIIKEASCKRDIMPMNRVYETSRETVRMYRTHRVKNRAINVAPYKIHAISIDVTSRNITCVSSHDIVKNREYSKHTSLARNLMEYRFMDLYHTDCRRCKEVNDKNWSRADKSKR